jgi:hypothetical protein
MFVISSHLLKTEQKIPKFIFINFIKKLFLTLWLLCVPFLVHTRPLPANYVARFGTHFFTTQLDPLCTLYGHDFRSLQSYKVYKGILDSRSL